MQEYMPVIQAAGMVLGSGGAAFVSVKIVLNGTVKRVERIENTVDDLRDRLARMEGRHEKVAE